MMNTGKGFSSAFLCSFIFILLILVKTSPLAYSAEKVLFDDLVPTPMIAYNFDTVKFHGQEAFPADIIEAIEGRYIKYRPLNSKVVSTEPWKKVEKIVTRITAGSVVTKRGDELLAIKDNRNYKDRIPSDIEELLEWGLKKNAVEETADLAEKAFAVFPRHSLLTEQVLTVFEETGRTAALKGTIRHILKDRPGYGRGYIILSKLYQEEGNEEELTKLLKQWKDALPTQPELLALLTERGENDREVNRKLFFLHKRTVAGYSYALQSLKIGRSDDVLRTTSKLRELSGDESWINALEACAYLQIGEVDTAVPILQESLQGLDTVDPSLKEMVLYNNGWLYYKQGDLEKAQEIWKDNNSTAAKFALAVLDHGEIGEIDAAASPLLQRRMRAYAVALALEEERTADARMLLEKDTGKRAPLFQAVLALQEDAYSKEATTRVRLLLDDDAVLWVVYAQIKQGEYEKALKTLAQLPDDDGQALAYRLYCYEAMGEVELAKKSYQQMLAAEDAPLEYRNTLAAYYYKARNDKMLVDDFAWVIGEVLPVGWNSSAIGTGIRIASDGKDLIFEGGQTSEEVSRAWRKMPKSEVRQISLSLELGNDNKSYAGLEIIDDEGLAGYALALKGNTVVWRSRRNGVWNAWEEVDAKSGSLQLWLDSDQIGDRQVQIYGASKRVPIGSLADLRSDLIQIGCFVEAPIGQQVKTAFKELRIQVKK